MTSTSPDHPVFGDGLPALPTWFAPPERASRNEVESAARVIADHSLMTALLEATDLYVMVLNQERQVLAANTEFLKALGATDLRALVGRRPGGLPHRKPRHRLQFRTAGQSRRRSLTRPSAPAMPRAVG
jgi:PAS domain-containing protein